MPSPITVFKGLSSSSHFSGDPSFPSEVLISSVFLPPAPWGCWFMCAWRFIFQVIVLSVSEMQALLIIFYSSPISFLAEAGRIFEIGDCA